jgi:hypothetical protein
MSGRELARELKEAGSKQRAMLAAEIAAGRLVVTPLPVSWANRICNANQRKAKRARAVLAAGKPQPASDDRLDRLLAELGVERVFASLDRITQPSLPLAAE